LLLLLLLCAQRRRHKHPHTRRITHPVLVHHVADDHQLAAVLAKVHQRHPPNLNVALKRHRAPACACG
jgi:hypothetical protein